MRTRGRQWGRRAAGVAALLVVAGCTGAGGQPILGARALPDEPNAVEVEFSGCESRPEVDVVESETAVRITLSGPNGGCEPLHELTVELEAPLDGRTLVDGATGDEVDVTR